MLQHNMFAVFILKTEDIEIFLTGLFSLSHFIQFSFVSYGFCEITETMKLGMKTCLLAVLKSV